MDPQVQQALMLWGGLIPGAVSFVLLLGAWYLHTRAEALRDDPETEQDGDERGARPKDGPRWLLPLLLFGGFLGANSAQYASIPWWPADNTYRLPHALAIVALLGFVEGLVRLPALVAFVLRALVYGAVFWVLAWGYRDNTMIFGSVWDFGGYWALAALGAALLASAHEAPSSKTRGWVDSGLWILVLGGAMPTLFFNGYATGAMVLGGVLSVLGAAAVVGLICGPLRLSRGGVTTLVGVALVMAIGASVHSGLNSLPAGLLLIGAVGAGTVAPRCTKSLPTLVTRGVIAALFLGAAAALAHHAQSAIESGGSDTYDPYSEY